MNPLKSLIVLPALVGFFGFAGSVLAQTPRVVLQFDGATYNAQPGDMELARTPKAARAATETIYAFGPASPSSGYSGPAFNLGYELKASAPVNLTVSPERCVLEDNYANGTGRFNDTITVTGQGNWPATETFSVAAAVVFPTDKFKLSSLSVSALNYTGNKAYNDKLRHRWVVRVDNKFYVSTANLGRPGRGPVASPVAVMDAHRFHGTSLMEWVEYDPSVSIFANLDGPRVMLGDKLDAVTAVGFYMDALDFPGNGPGRQWELRLITLTATGVPVK